jgi:simple sugar transport system permease protein/ribose transport system permease protein
MIPGANTRLKSNGFRHRITDLLLGNIVWIMLIGFVFAIGVIAPQFLTFNILKNVVVQASVIGVLAIGVSFTLLIGEIDLSATGNMAVSSLIGAILMTRYDFPWYLAIPAVIAIAVCIGAINGILVAKLKVLALMETLALNMVLQGVMVYATHGAAVTGLPKAYKFLGQGKIGGIELMPIIFLIIYLLISVLWKRTVVGRRIFAVGGNKHAANVSGIRVDATYIIVFMICGFFAGIAGVLLSGYTGAVTSSFGEEYMLTAIAASVIGGVSLLGGQGKVSGVLGGVLLLSVVKVGLQIAGIDAYIISMVEGILVFAAVLVDSLRLKYQSRL